MIEIILSILWLIAMCAATITPVGCWFYFRAVALQNWAIERLETLFGKSLQNND